MPLKQSIWLLKFQHSDQIKVVWCLVNTLERNDECEFILWKELNNGLRIKNHSIK